MQLRPFGTTDLHIAPIVFGGNVFGWTADEATSFRLLDAFVDAGFNAIDTADVYSRWKPGNVGGESETILGKWMQARGNRAHVTLFTKVGMEMGPNKIGLSKAYIIEAVEASLKRLQTDHIDLYQSHKDDLTTPFEETHAAYAELIQQGKVRYIGASNYSAERLAESIEVCRKNGLPEYRSLQPLYNLSDRAPYEAALEGVCAKYQLAVIPYYSLASGFLTGKYRSLADVRDQARAAKVKTYLDDRGQRILTALDTVASAHQSVPAKVALAWLLAKPTITAPIASATTVEQLRELLDAVSLSLTTEDVALLDAASM